MNPESLKRLLAAVAAGETTPDDALHTLRDFPGGETPEATIDHQRGLRCGFPEVIFGQNKTAGQVLAIAERIVEGGNPLLATRLQDDGAAALAERFPDGTRVEIARLFYRPGLDPLPPAGKVVVISAGTSDFPVAEEAAWTAIALGAPVERLRDVGVAGLHRILAHRSVLREASALVVVAGMEGALPSVVGGLTDRPLIAVPTSVGYGANFGGLAALLAMLNSCASGVTVVNIDNGFSAGYAAALIARLAASPPPTGGSATGDAGR
jgi:NCAIR mutase (PurE)-related protein